MNTRGEFDLLLQNDLKNGKESSVRHGGLDYENIEPMLKPTRHRLFHD